MSILFLLSNSSLPPPSLRTSSNLFRGRKLEAREGSLGSSYHSDLLDLLFAFLSTMDAVPTPNFPASPEALTAVLVQSCHRPPGVLTGFVSLAKLSLMKLLINIIPNSILYFSFLCMRFPALTTLGVPPPDVLAIEEAVRHILLRCSLPQALDFLHTQLLAGICVANPVRDSPTIHPLSSSCMLPYFSSASFTRGRRSSPVSLLDHSPHLPLTWLSSVSNVTLLPGPASPSQR